MQSKELQETTYVIGHKNPDTDSICSAICYAALKERTGGSYTPARAGQINDETRFVLEHFAVPVPRLMETVETQVRDTQIRRTKRRQAGAVHQKGVEPDAGERHLHGACGLVKKVFWRGLITVGDIAKSYMSVYDSHILSQANTQYANIVETLQGTTVGGDSAAHFSQGKVLVAAANPDVLENYIEKGDLVILGNRYESQLCAIEMEAGCIVVCEGAGGLLYHSQAGEGPGLRRHHHALRRFHDGAADPSEHSGRPFHADGETDHL